MNLLNRKAARAAVMALALGAVAMPALPVQAQTFTFEFGTGGGGFWGGGRHHRPHVRCLTDYQVRQRIAQYGYSNIRLNVPNGSYIQVKATRGARTYLIDFNRCTGRIEGATRLGVPRGHWNNTPWNRGRPHWNGNQRGGDDKDEAGDLH